jgi:hypothetical protein
MDLAELYFCFKITNVAVSNGTQHTKPELFTFPAHPYV